MSDKAQQNRSSLSRELFERFKDSTGRAEWKGVEAAYRGAQAEGKSGILAAYDHLHRDSPSLLAELRGMWRGGRDDFLRILMGADMAASPGAPGQPTQALITEGLTGQPVNARADVIEQQHQRGMRM